MDETYTETVTYSNPITTFIKLPNAPTFIERTAIKSVWVDTRNGRPKIVMKAIDPDGSVYHTEIWSNPEWEIGGEAMAGLWLKKWLQACGFNVLPIRDLV